jgi:hypothetical protein
MWKLPSTSQIHPTTRNFNINITDLLPYEKVELPKSRRRDDSLVLSIPSIGLLVPSSPSLRTILGSAWQDHKSKRLFKIETPGC